MGQDARQQLAVTGRYASGQLRDLTRAVTYDIKPAGVVSIDPTGLVVPLADGEATITARTAEGIVGGTKVVVSRFGNEALVNFPNQIVPISSPN